MKVLIFASEESVLSFLEAQPKSIFLLDYTGSSKIKTAVPEVVNPADIFSMDEKEQIKNEYIEVISDLDVYNNHSLYWLCHPIAEKNDLARDNLFDRVVDFLIFYRVYQTHKDETLVVLPQRETIIRSIVQFLSEMQDYCWCESGEPWKMSPFKRLKKWGKKQLTLIHGALDAHKWNRKTRHLLDRLERNKSYTIIRTWFDHRSLSLLEKTEDIYLGTFPHFLLEQGREILYFGDYVYGFDHLSDIFKKEYKNPLVMVRSLVGGIDFLKAAWFTRNVKHNLHLKTGIKILLVDVDRVFYRFFEDYAQHPQIQVNYLSYLAMKQLMKRVTVDVLYLPYENYAWEKLSWLSVRQSRQNTKIVAFQHAQVALNATKLFWGKKDQNTTFLPDRIVTLGEITHDLLIKRCNYPEQKVVIGCALRQNYRIEKNPIQRNTDKKVLVQLWSVPKSVRLINFLHASKIHMGKYHVTLNPHPNNPLEVLIPQLNFKYDSDYLLAEGSLIENFRRHGVVIYHGTTSCLDALANGLPVIEVELNDFISVDPLFSFNDFKWTVRKPEELERTIDKIFALSDEEYYRRQQKGFEFVHKYFYPVNRENLEAFLI